MLLIFNILEQLDPKNHNYHNLFTHTIIKYQLSNIQVTLYFTKVT